MVEVTQADREAAAAIAVLPEMRELILSGRADHHAEPFARHRHAEREAVVKWLRSCRSNKLAHHRSVCHYEDDEILDAIITAANTFGYAADTIKAGEHLK